MRYKAFQVLGATALATICSTAVQAQVADTAQLMGMDLRSLESEIQSRYDAGLAASLDPAIQGADDARYLWALEAKTQCGIALGFLKSSTKDETSISRCALASQMMTYQPAPPPAPAPVVAPPPPQSPAICDDEIVGIVFFDFDESVVTPEAGQTLDTIVANIPICGWRSFTIVGHTDQAGSDAYNLVLSQDRADAVEAALGARGVAGTMMTTSAEGESNPRVPLPDGTRSPQNRRVEIAAE